MQQHTDTTWIDELSSATLTVSNILHIIYNATWPSVAQRLQDDTRQTTSKWKAYLKSKFMMYYTVQLHSDSQLRQEMIAHIKWDIELLLREIEHESVPYWNETLQAALQAVGEPTLVTPAYTTETAEDAFAYVQYFAKKAIATGSLAVMCNHQFDLDGLEARRRELEHEYQRLSAQQRTQCEQNYQTAVSLLDKAIAIASNQPIARPVGYDDEAFIEANRRRLTYDKDRAGTENWQRWVDAYTYVAGEELLQENFSSERYSELNAFAFREAMKSDRARTTVYPPEDVIKNPRPDMGVRTDDGSVSALSGWYEKYVALAWDESPTDDIIEGFLSDLSKNGIEA